MEFQPNRRFWPNFEGNIKKVAAPSVVCGVTAGTVLVKKSPEAFFTRWCRTSMEPVPKCHELFRFSNSRALQRCRSGA